MNALTKVRVAMIAGAALLGVALGALAGYAMDAFGPKWFVLGLGVGCAQPMMMSLLYALAPPNRLAEAFGLHKTLRNATHLVVPLVFGSVGTAFGFAAVFLSNSGLLATGGFLMRKVGIPRSQPAARQTSSNVW